MNHSLNQAYFVEKRVFENIVKKAIKNSKLSKLNSFEVEILSSKNDFRVEISTKIKKGSSYKESLLELTSEIERLSYNIIESKPENITIVVDGEF